MQSRKSAIGKFMGDSANRKKNTGKAVSVPAVIISPQDVMTQKEAEALAIQQAKELEVRSRAFEGMWAQSMVLAENFISRPEQASLPDYYMEPISSRQSITSPIRVFVLKRLAFDPKERLTEKLTNVYAAMHSIGASIFTLVHGERTGQTHFYIGCRCDTDPDMAGEMLRGSLEGNLPGMILEERDSVHVKQVLDEYLPLKYDNLHVCSLSVSAAERNGKPNRQNTVQNVQSIDKFTEVMKGKEYTALFLAEPISSEDAASKKYACEDVLTAVSKFAKTSIAYNEGSSVGVNESIAHGFSKTISEGYNRSTSRGTSRSIGRSSGDSSSYSYSVSGQNWLGQNATASSSYGESSNASENRGSSSTHTTGFSVNQSEGESVNVSIGVSSTQSQGVTFTLNMENRRISELITKLEYEVKKLDSGASFGLWDTAAYMISHEASTAMMGINEIRAILLGEESEKCESHINHWGSSKMEFDVGIVSGTQRHAPVKELMAFLHYGIHPVFKRSLLPGKTPQSDPSSPLYDPDSPLYNPVYDSRAKEYNPKMDPQAGGYRLEDDPNSDIYDVYTHSESPYYSEGIYDPEYCRRVGKVPLDKPLDPTKYYFTPAVSLPGTQLPIFIGLPEKSIPGVTVTEMAEFGRNVVTDDPGEPGKRRIRLGEVMHMGKSDQTPVELYVNSLTGHAFVCGAPGSGKSNTIYQMLYGLARLDEQPERDTDEKGNRYGSVKFLIIEPAKGEYKFAFGGMPGIHIFTSKDNEANMLRINPFSFPYQQMGVMEHIERVKNIVTACWALTAAMPAMLANALETAYLRTGWDLKNSIYTRPGKVQFPSFYTVLEVLPQLIEESGYSDEAKGDYTGALVTRVQSLTKGIAGSIFTDIGTADDRVLFDENTVIDLSSVGSTESRALIMGMLVMKLENYRRATATMANYPLRHVTVLEEAHNLLPRVNTSQSNESSNVQGKSVEMISSAIAEMRTYGEGFIIVDQSPHQVAEVAVSNTSTKIIMRLPGEKDVKSAGSSIGLKDDQKRQITMLPQGQAIVKQGNWVMAVTAHIDRAPSVYAVDQLPRYEYDLLKSFRTYILQICKEALEQNQNNEVFPIIQRDRVLNQIEREEDVALHRKDIIKSRWKELCAMGMDERMEKSCYFTMDVLSFYDGLRICAPKWEMDADSDGIPSDEQLIEWIIDLTEMLRNYMDVQDAYEDLVQDVVSDICKYCSYSMGPTIEHFRFGYSVLARMSEDEAAGAS